jgi:hypothetical protein
MTGHCGSAALRYALVCPTFSTYRRRFDQARDRKVKFNLMRQTAAKLRYTDYAASPMRSQKELYGTLQRSVPFG